VPREFDVIRRATNHAAATLFAFLTLLALPAVAFAGSGATGLTGSGGTGLTGSGGTGLSPTSTPTSGTTPSDNPLVGNGDATVTASGAGISVSTTATALLRNQLTFTGTAPSSDSGDVVEIERRGRETDYAWTPTVQAAVTPDGSFTAAWATDHIGQFSIRAIVQSTDAQVAAASPSLAIVIYLPAIATYYGPGFFGRTMACGGVLRRQTLGVANRSLPCGTKVDLLYHGQTLTVPVVDRGPFANGAKWDLTEATSTALGITGTETIGAASVAKQPAP
jgi:rare lipoprotein A